MNAANGAGGCLDGSIDFGIIAFPIRRPNLTVVPWLEEPLVLVCAPQHPLAQKRKVSVGRLEGHYFIAFERDIPTRRIIDRMLRDHGVAVERVMEFDNVETIKRAVEIGSGVSVLPHATVMDELKRGALVKVDFTRGRFTRTIGMVYRRGRVLSGAAREFMRLMVPARV